jgi:hypothetical protein
VLLGGLVVAVLAVPCAADDANGRPNPKPANAAKYLLREFRHSDHVWTVAYSPDGKVLAAGGEDRVIRTWDAATGKELLKISANGCVCVAFSPDGKVLASAPGGAAQVHEPQLWDPATGKELRRCKGHANICYFVAFSPDGKQLASASVDQTVRLWETASGKEARALRGHTSNVLRVAISPDGKSVASVSDDQTVRLWDAATGKERHVMSGHSGQVLAVNFSPDSSLMASGGGDGTLRLWDVRSGREVRQCLTNRTQMVSSVCFSRDGHSLAAALGSGRVALIEVATGRERWSFDDSTKHVYSVCFSPDGKTLASGGADGLVRQWDYLAPGRDDQPKAGELSEKELDALWRKLGGDDAAAAYSAIGTLAGARHGEGVHWIRRQLKPAPVVAKGAVSAERIAKLIADLDDDDFEVREKASAGLRILDKAAESAMRQALEKTKSAEVRNRLEKLLERLDNHSIPPEELLVIRAVEILERAGGGEAVDVLRGLAKGAESARLTREARAALARLSAR